MAISPVIIMVVWLTISIRYINFIITDDIDLMTFFKMILYVLPDILSMIIPLCFLISAMHVFNKMRIEQEITVIMTAGRSIAAIARPLLLLGTMLSISMFYIQSNLTPYSYKNMETIQKYIKNKVSLNIIKPGIFNVIGNSVVYIESKTDSSIEDIFISYIPKNSGKTNIITAKKGKCIINDNNLFITLEHGFRQVLDKKNNIISTAQFESFSYDITEFMKRYDSSSNRLHEKTQSELFELARITPDNTLKVKYLAEAHGRYLISVVPLINALIIAVFLIAATHRSREIIKLIYAFCLGLISQIGTISLVNISKKNVNFISYEYGIVLFIILSMTFITLRRKI